VTHKALSEILTKYGDSRQVGSRLEVPPSIELTVFAALGEESMVIERVRSLELEGEYAVVATARGERYVLLYEDVRAVRFGGGAASAGYDR
jgi:hypothetical protein